MLITSIFSFFHCFEKTSFSDVSKGVIVWEWVKGVLGKELKIIEIRVHFPEMCHGKNLPSICLINLNMT